MTCPAGLPAGHDRYMFCGPSTHLRSFAALKGVFGLCGGGLFTNNKLRTGVWPHEGCDQANLAALFAIVCW